MTMLTPSAPPSQAQPTAKRDTAIMRLLAAAVTIGFFAVIAALIHGDVNPQGHDVLLVMLGALGTAWATIINYYFGSSDSSAVKDHKMAVKS